jgi:hypothetical protein
MRRTTAAFSSSSASRPALDEPGREFARQDAAAPPGPVAPRRPGCLPAVALDLALAVAARELDDGEHHRGHVDRLGEDRLDGGQLDDLDPAVDDAEHQLDGVAELLAGDPVERLDDQVAAGLHAPGLDCGQELTERRLVAALLAAVGAATEVGEGEVGERDVGVLRQPSVAHGFLPPDAVAGRLGWRAESQVAVGRSGGGFHRVDSGVNVYRRLVHGMGCVYVVVGTEHIPLDRQTLSYLCQTYQAASSGRTSKPRIRPGRSSAR